MSIIGDSNTAGNIALGYKKKNTGIHVYNVNGTK
jgi:hypothetical protein